MECGFMTRRNVRGWDRNSIVTCKQYMTRCVENRRPLQWLVHQRRSARSCLPQVPHPRWT
ncbi:hypothetical protein DPMN_016545 [Dreissena polymorpha]|uniref:Uncharacterized protein n=1 Tax=Dreissena polymorpha TaxID=45954 RepID=A0A9D4S7A2_DREPO|nr:hypothetical protein DPMN_016545 [Dreissena polymorpha]